MPVRTRVSCQITSRGSPTLSEAMFMRAAPGVEQTEKVKTITSSRFDGKRDITVQERTGASVNISDAQRDVRSVFLGGFAGQLVSSAVWFVSTAAATWYSRRSAME